MRESFSLYRPRDGHPDWERLADEARALAATLLPSLERPRTGRAERRRRARSHATAFGNFVRNRRLDRAGREDLRPLYFIWTVLRACNFRCTYCDDHRGRKYPDLPDDGVLTTAQGRRLLRIMRTGTPSVYFAGGEPTLRQDLPLLTREARDLDYFPIIVNTNGSAIDRLLARPAWRTWLADTDVVVVSLDGLEPASLATMWAYRRPERVLRNLLVLRELASAMRVKLMVNTVVQPGAVRHARDVLDFANDLGIWFCPVPMNTGPTVSAGLAADPEYAALTELILARKRAGYRITGSVRMNRRLLRSEPLRCRNALKPHIDFDGALQWPCKASVHVEPERIDVLAFEDVDALYEAASRRVDPTRFHGPARNQCGASCNWAQNYTTDAYAHGLRHPLSLLAEVGGFLGGRR
jgi:MoaA/NifB/PqqE/SkfB family radical SAM enzyme